MKKVLWIGSYIPSNFVPVVDKFGYYNPASFLSQSNIVDGIEHNLGHKIDKIGVLSFCGFPKERIFFKRMFNKNDDCVEILSPVLNIKFFNKLSERFRLKREIKKYIKTINSNELDVFIYEMRTSCLSLTKYIKSKIPNAKFHLIIPDLPLFMDQKMGLIKRGLKRMDWCQIQKNIKQIDDYIVYTEPMVDYLNIRDKKWLVMEGLINTKDLNHYLKIKYEPISTQKTIIMYSGGIKESFGIKVLLAAMEKLDQSFELWITGRGDFEKNVLDCSKTNNNIKYFGYIQSRDEVTNMQLKSSILINMRNPHEESSKYSFPSKLFEFMLTGKPVLTPKLGGIPTEYYQYLISFDNFTAECLADAIKKVSSLSIEEKENIKINEQNFISAQKNNIFQSRKIIDFISKNNL